MQVTEGLLAKTSCSELEELASSELEDSWESEEPGTSTDEELSALAESIRRSVAAAEFDVVGSVTCSVGATMLRRDDVLESWFERADQAVYAAKSEGRDKVCML